MITRRLFLASSACITLLPRLSLASSSTRLTASEVEAQILPDEYPASKLWGYNNSTPGPILRTKQNETISIQFENELNAPSSIHWHGIRIDNAMDGVPDLTQAVVEPNDYFDYDFKTPDAGTYWYHAHNRSQEQVARGLYGALIVEELNPPNVDYDEVVLLDDWQIKETGELNEDFDNLHEQSMAGALGNFARAFIRDDLVLKQNDRIRLRLINVATDRVFSIELTSVQGKIVALDGMPLEKPVDLQSLTLAPAQRADLIVDVLDTLENAVLINFVNSDGSFELGSIPIEGVNDSPFQQAITALPLNELAEPNLDNAIDIPFTLSGGMGMAMMMGDSIWTINGKGGLDDIPLHSFNRGETGLIRIVNDTGFSHGIHLHGHHFREVKDGNALGPLRDTILLDAEEERMIACVFDNPGKWLMHCHMLGHQASGMKTWIEVA